MILYIIITRHHVTATVIPAMPGKWSSSLSRASRATFAHFVKRISKTKEEKLQQVRKAI